MTRKYLFIGGPLHRQWSGVKMDTGLRAGFPLRPPELLPLLLNGKVDLYRRQKFADIRRSPDVAPNEGNVAICRRVWLVFVHCETFRPRRARRALQTMSGRTLLQLLDPPPGADKPEIDVRSVPRFIAGS